MQENQVYKIIGNLIVIEKIHIQSIAWAAILGVGCALFMCAFSGNYPRLCFAVLMLLSIVVLVVQEGASSLLRFGSPTVYYLGSFLCFVLISAAAEWTLVRIGIGCIQAPNAPFSFERSVATLFLANGVGFFLWFFGRIYSAVNRPRDKDDPYRDLRD